MKELEYGSPAELAAALASLIVAYRSDEATMPVMIDNDHIYADNDEGNVFSMHPDEVLIAAFTLLGIPYERV